MDRITIITAGAAGVSVGLGLKAAGLEDTEIVGASGNGGLLAAASRMGAFDDTSGNLSSALKGAGLVVMDLAPVDTRELMEAIGPVLEDDCVVTDTGTNKVQVLEWAKSYLREDVSFVGGRPLPREALLEIEDASASIFQGTDYCVIPAEDARPKAVKTVVGMVDVLGARPLFLSALEHDSFTAAVAHLPRVLSSALVGSVSASASWREIARVAGPEFDQVSRLAVGDPRDGAAACLSSPDAVVHWIDQVIAELSSYRDGVRRGGDGLHDAFANSQEALARWKADAVVEDKRPAVPGAGQALGQMFLGGRLTRRLKQLRGSSNGSEGRRRKDA